jgi:hypothetical protein
MNIRQFFLVGLFAGSVFTHTPARASGELIQVGTAIAGIVFIVWLNFFEMEKNIPEEHR